MPDASAGRPQTRPGLLAAMGAALDQGRVSSPSPLPSWTGPLFHALHAFLENRCLLLASALSYTTVLSLVPFLAVAFSIAKGLGLYNAPQVHDVLLRLTANRMEVVEHILEYIQNTNVKTLGAIGTAMLLVTAVSLLSTVEGALNALWKAESERALWTRFTGYLALIVVCPVLLFAALSATASLQGSAVSQWMLGFSLAHFAVKIFLALLPFLIIWTIFFLLYKFLPNTEVNIRPALIGAVSAGSIWQIVQWAYIKFQFGAASYNAIYGSFAQIPLLLLWLYVSWVIVLLGAQISHTVQRYGQDVSLAQAADLTQADRHALGLLLSLVAARAAAERRLPPPVPVLAGRLGLPVAVVEGILGILAQAGLLAETAASTQGRIFVPLARPEDVPAAEVLQALDGYGDPQRSSAWINRFDVARDLLRTVDTRSQEPTLAKLAERFGPALDGLKASSG